MGLQVILSVLLEPLRAERTPDVARLRVRQHVSLQVLLALELLPFALAVGLRAFKVARRDFGGFVAVVGHDDGWAVRGVLAGASGVVAAAHVDGGRKGGGGRVDGVG